VVGDPPAGEDRRRLGTRDGRRARRAEVDGARDRLEDGIDDDPAQHLLDGGIELVGDGHLDGAIVGAAHGVTPSRSIRRAMAA